jgi:acetoin:2,6-dichlorophenolindophenol oxidoreductase subunit beta
MSDVSFLDSIRAALRDEMACDRSVYLFGEDVAIGGPFGVTRGLAQEFGAHRVVNTPISEGTVMGLAIGAAAVGLRPVVEIMFVDFVTLALDQLVNHAAKLRYMTGGQVKIPLTVRVQCGIGGTMGAQHSQSFEAWFAHVPGLKAALPATPADANGLLRTAIRDDDPVIFIEHRGLYRNRGESAPPEHVVPLGKAAVLKQGSDLTIAALGSMVPVALEAAAELANGGVSAEVIDLRTISPLDSATIAGSVKKTGRLIVAHEEVEQAGIGAEIIARVQREAFYYLDSPIVRIAAPFAPIPASPALEKYFVPGKDRIVSAARQVMAPG